MLLIALIIPYQVLGMESDFELGGGLLSFTPRIVASYCWKNLEINAGVTLEEEQTVFSAGGRFYIETFRNLPIEPYVGASLFLTEEIDQVPPPPPAPPSPEASSQSTEAEGGMSGRRVLGAVDGGIKLSMPKTSIPVNLYIGFLQLFDDRESTEDSFTGGIVVGLTMTL